MGHYNQFRIPIEDEKNRPGLCPTQPLVYSTPVIIGGDSTVYQRAYDLGVEIPSEMMEFVEVMILGAAKYAPNNWLLPNGTNSDHRSMHASLFRHVAESSCGSREDKETKLDPLLHVACRALMMYTRIKRGMK